MPGTVVVGTQWGDEGKGRLTDNVAKENSMVVRYQGGHNAGHTLVVGDDVFKLQLIPSGVLYDHIIPVIANGVVVDPLVLLAEIASLEDKGVDCSRLKVSGHAHMVLSYHSRLDAIAEDAKGDAALGTTRRGIGPAYSDKASRLGLRIEDLFDPKVFRERLEMALVDKNFMLGAMGEDLIDADEVADLYLGEVADAVKPYVADTVDLINNALETDQHVLFEGAQATFLDLDHGTYPFVTSSNPVAGAATVGAGIGPHHLTRVIGIVKAYLTRVGAGPFPTELFDADGDSLTEIGAEFGTNTGRRRRVGWLDLVMLRQAVRLNGLTELAITKLDVLDTFETIKVCDSYSVNGQKMLHMPQGTADLEIAEPNLVEFKGWQTNLSECRTPRELPQEASDYLAYIADQVGVPIRLVCVGPDRQQFLTFPEF